MTASLFQPYSDLAGRLLPHAFGADADGSHDLSHLVRVWRNVRLIRAHEGGRGPCLLAATILHDCVQVEKNSDQRAVASVLSATRAHRVLAQLGWVQGDIDIVTHAIEAHSHSARIAPRTPEAKILQDADRLDAIGVIGVARCFYVAGRMGSALCDPLDPQAKHRPLDDSRFALDHFRTKLLRLSDGFQTATGKKIAQARHEELQRFYDTFVTEAGIAE